MGKKLLGGLLALALVAGFASPALAALSVSGNLQMDGLTTSRIDFGRGGSYIYDNGNLHILTDDNLEIDASGTTYLSGGLRVAGTSSLVGAVSTTAGLTVGNALTVTAGGATITAGGLTVTAGGATVTAGGLIVDAGATRLDGALTVGASATTGQDVTFYSDTSGDHFLYDASEQQLILIGADGVAALDIQDGTLEVADGLTVDTGGATITAGGLTVTAGGATVTAGNITYGTTVILSGEDTATLSGIDAIDATTEATIEAAIDTLSNLTSVGTIGAGTWEATAIADAYVANDITASNYLPLAGGTMAGQLVFYNAADGSGSTEGSVYYDTTDDNLYVYADGGWVDLTAGAAGATSLDTAYNTDAGERTILVDEGTVSWDMSGAYNFVVDIQGSGNFIVQDAGTAVFTVADGGTATHVGALTVGSDGAGHAVTFYSDTAGDYMQWSDSGVALTIIGTDGSNALAVTDGNVAITDSLDVGGTTTLDATSITLAAGEAVAISATANTAESLDITATAAGNDAVEINFTLVDDDDADTVAALDLIVTSADTGDADNLRAINIANITAQDNVVESAIVIGTGWTNSITVGAGEMLFTAGNLQLNDSVVFSLGSSDDLQFTHNGTNSVITSAVGDLIVDNTLATGSSIFRLGTDTSATDFQVQNNSETALLTVDGSGVVTISGTADNTTALQVTAGDVYIIDGDLDLDSGDFDVLLDAAEEASIAKAGATDADPALYVDNTTALSDTSGSKGLYVKNTISNYADDNAADTHIGLDVLVAQNASDAGTNDITYGIRVQDLGGSAQDNNEYAIYQAGTGWDYGLYISDASYFAGASTFMGAVTVGADGTTDLDVIFYGDTAGDYMMWDAGDQTLKIEGTAAATALNVATGNTVLGGDFTVNTDDFVVDADGDITLMPTGNDVIVGVDGTGHDVRFYSDTASESLVWDDGNANLTLTTIVADTTSVNALDLKITDNTSTSGDVIGISLSQENGSGAGFAAGIDVVNNDDTAMTIGQRIRAVTGNITTALQIIASADKTITDGIKIGDGSGTITDGIDVSSATTMTNALNVGANAIAGTTGAITYTGATTWSSTGGDLTLHANHDSYDLILAGGDNLPGAVSNGKDVEVRAEDDFIVTVTDDVLIDATGGIVTVDGGEAVDAAITLQATADGGGVHITAGDGEVSAVGTNESIELRATADTIVALTAGGSLVVDGDTTNSTNTDGAIDLNVGTVTDGAIGLHIAMTQDDGAEDGVDAIAQSIVLTANDATGDMFGLKITGAATDNAAAGSYEAGIVIDNADDAAGSMPDAILVTSSGVDAGVTDAIDASAANITNALNVGANTIAGTTAVINFSQFDLAATGKTDWVMAAAGQLTIDAAATDNTTTTGVIDINHDSTASSQAINIASAVVDDDAIDTQQGILVTMTNNADDSDVVYGIQVAELGGSASGGNEYAIYQAGTAWDYGLYISDDVHFNTKVNLGKMTSAADPDDGAITVTASYFEWTPAGAGTATFAEGTEGDLLIMVNLAANTITLSDGAGNIISGGQELGQYDTATFVNNGDDWVLIATTNN